MTLTRSASKARAVARHTNPQRQQGRAVARTPSRSASKEYFPDESA